MKRLEVNADPAPLYDAMIRAINECYADPFGEIEANPDPQERLEAYVAIATNKRPVMALVKIRIRAEKAFKEIRRTV